MTALPSYEDVLAFWFGPLDAEGCANEAHRARWYSKSETFDAELGRRFGALLKACARGELTEMCSTPRGRLAYVIVLDQLSRNIYRGTPEMYEQDERALAVVEEGMSLGVDRALALDERQFFYMPFMHAEDLPAQERCCALFAQLADEVPPSQAPAVRRSHAFAVAHRDIIARFGRFPHRNSVIGRTSTPDENAFLLEPGSSF